MDGVEFLIDLVLRETQYGAVEMNVLATGKFRCETRAKLE